MVYEDICTSFCFPISLDKQLMVNTYHMMVKIMRLLLPDRPYDHVN
jgi:hypothetical protein